MIDSSKEDIGHRVLQVTNGKGVYAAFDAVGGQAPQQLLSAVQDEGTMVMYGVLSGMTMTTGELATTCT